MKLRERVFSEKPPRPKPALHMMVPLRGLIGRVTHSFCEKGPNLESYPKPETPKTVNLKPLKP